MTLPDFLGHLGYASIMVGMILLARKNIWGWVFRGLGEALWVLIGIMLDLSSAWFWGTLFLGIEIYGFRKWRQASKGDVAQPARASAS